MYSRRFFTSARFIVRILSNIDKKRIFRYSIKDFVCMFLTGKEGAVCRRFCFV